jgi:hypothetical protein
MPQIVTRQSEADARAHLLEMIEQAGVELIQIAGVAREHFAAVPADLLDDLMAAIQCAQREVLRYRQLYEIETPPQHEIETRQTSEE